METSPCAGRRRPQNSRRPQLVPLPFLSPARPRNGDPDLGAVPVLHSSQYFHPDHMSSSEKQKLELKKVGDRFKLSESDCGSARVQGLKNQAKPSQAQYISLEGSSSDGTEEEEVIEVS